MALVERDDILRQLDLLLAECTAGSGRVVLIDGPVGTGKTELVRYCGTRAAGSGVTVRAATCARAEHVLPLGVVGQLLRGLPAGDGETGAGTVCTGPDGAADPDTARGTDTLCEEATQDGCRGREARADGAGRAARIAELLDVGAAIAGRLGPDPDRELVQIHQELTLLLLDLSKRGPVLLCIDDVQYADVPSLHFLLHLVRRLGSARIAVLLAGDLASHPLDLPFRAELVRAPEFRSLRVGPLSPAGSRDLLAAATPVTPDPSVTDPYQVTGGNPLLLTALVQDDRGFGQPGPEVFGLALLSCLHRGEPVAVQVARALAVLETPVPDGVVAPDTATLAGMIGADVPAAARALDAMNAAGLLDDGRFRHKVARDAVLGDLTASERTDLHRRAARLRHQQGAPAATVAAHLVEGNDVQPPWGTGVLVEAAEQALLDGRPERAAACLRLAARSAAGERERAAIRARLAHAEWQTSPAAAARHLSPLVSAAHAGLLEQRTNAALVRQLLWHGRSAEAEDLLARMRAVAQAEPEDDAAEVHDLEVWLATVHPPLARRRRGPAAGSAVPAAPAADSWLRSAALLADAVAAGGHRTGREPGPSGITGAGVAGTGPVGSGLVGADRAESALRDLHLARADPWAGEVALLALLLLTRAPRMDAAVAWCERVLADPDLEDQTARAMATAVRGALALEQGDLAVAADHARAALRRLPAKAWGVAIGLPLGTLVLAAIRTGDLEEAARQLVQTVPEEMVASRYGLDYLHARGHYHLAANHAHAALADFLACGDLIRGWGLDAAVLVPWRIGAAEAWLRLGNVDQARQLAQEQLGRPGATRVRGLALRLLAAASPPGRRLQPLTEALELLEATGDRLGQAYVLADLSRVHDHLDQRRRARLLLRRALHIATMCGARPLAQELLAISGDGRAVFGLGADQEMITGLTDSERRVASLAVMGYTNREIALRLYVTPSTVEQHLTRVYRKLNVKRRQDLPADLWTDATHTG
ncbi:AAA family ATPase [Frankia sp. Mgl5]|uniref:helix-turn-helix transcriptional regulator n=1 Tax=Frankia sp. Mgl5 TaxID=2933793 RepID=UPI00200C05F5|nr:LuxR family transcriptional regulator [Frankia sp. Mgl5]MCK9931128.1 AAA family ATPase [Frankia sp. Mgl5]